MTAADLARIYNVSTRTIRRWAAQDDWRRKRTGHVTRYNLTDAEQTRRQHEARHTARPPSLHTT